LTEDGGAGVEASLHSDDGVAVVRISARYEADIEEVWSALTEPVRLARWFGNVTGELHADGEFTAFVLASEWDGAGRINVCVPPQTLSVTMWEEEGVEHVASAQLVADGSHTNLELVVRGVPMEVLWAYGAGWQVHVEDLGAHLLGHDRADMPIRSDARFQELEPYYRAMPVVPLER
jgi:uncharacterized protein YndB with AHSA1/START domain